MLFLYEREIFLIVQLNNIILYYIYRYGVTEKEGETKMTQERNVSFYIYMYITILCCYVTVINFVTIHNPWNWKRNVIWLDAI